MAKTLPYAHARRERLVERMDRRFYPGEHRHSYDERFCAEICRYLGRAHVLLDLGAGAGIVPAMNLRGRAARVYGLDPDERVLENPYLDEARVGRAEAMPFADESFDVVVSDNVFEHLAYPEPALREVARVLKPGGLLFVKTPNRLHYMPLVAMLTPLRFHRFVNRVRGRASEDTYPTLYRANSPRVLTRLARRVGLELERLELAEGRPEYLRMWAPTYLLGLSYERVVNRFAWLARFRILLLARFRKPTATERMR